MTRRNRIPVEQRERIVRAFEDEERDYLLVTDTFRVNRSTARCIVARYFREARIRERPRGGRKNVRGDNEMRHCQRKLFTRTYSDKPWTKENATSQTRDPWPHRIKDIRWDAVSSKTGKAPRCWQKQTWCPEQESRLRDMIYELCCSPTLCIGRRMRLQHLDGQKLWQSATRREREAIAKFAASEEESWLWQWQYDLLMDLCFPPLLLAEWMQPVSIISWHRRGQIWIQKSPLSLYMTEHRPTETLPFSP